MDLGSGFYGEVYRGTLSTAQVVGVNLPGGFKSKRRKVVTKVVAVKVLKGTDIVQIE